MLNSMKALNKGELDKVDENLIFPMITWSSGYEKNAKVCKLLNRNIFYIDKHLATLVLSLGIKPKPFIPYPKQSKVDDKKYDLIIYYLVKDFKYGKSDLSSLHNIIINMVKNKTIVEEFSERYGLDNKERKLLGLKPLKFDKTKMKPKKGIDLFSM